MTREKQILLQDLSGRLPYGVIGLYSWKNREPHNRELTGSLFDELKSSWDSTEDSQFLPYLRLMSSMTEEEKEQWLWLTNDSWWGMTERMVKECIDFLNKNMFDYRGLIEKGLAIAVTEDDNPYKD